MNLITLFSVPNVPGESSGRNGSCPSGRGAYLQHLVAPPKVAGDRGGQFGRFGEARRDVMNSRVRGVDEDSVSQPQLAEAVKPLHCWVCMTSSSAAESFGRRIARCECV